MCKSSVTRIIWQMLASLLSVIGLSGCATSDMAESQDSPVEVINVDIGASLTLDLGGGEDLQMVWVPPGEFEMGSTDGSTWEQPVHQVVISKGFWMGKYEVTRSQWAQVMKGDAQQGAISQWPMQGLSWNYCQEFLRTLNQKMSVKTPLGGVNFRLPTEAEWEYACRAGTKSRYYLGDAESDLERVAWYSKNSSNVVHSVGQKEPNPFGLYDMLGNVWEICRDRYGLYQPGKAEDPTGPSANMIRRIMNLGAENHVMRGGSGGNDKDGCTVFARMFHQTTLVKVGNAQGFRVVLGAPL